MIFRHRALFALLIPLATLAACDTLHLTPMVPAAIAAPEGNLVANILRSEGKLRHQCRTDPAGGFSWTTMMGSALLMDESGAIVGRHYLHADGVQVWTHQDGSEVSGMEIANHAAPGDFSQQLFRAKPAAARGTMAGVTYIQRLHTVAGAVTSICAADKLGSMQSVNYTADYYFYKTTYADRVEPM